MQEIEFNLRQSTQHAWFLGVLVFLAILALLLANLPLLVRLGLIPLVLYYGYGVYLRDVMLTRPSAILSFALLEGGLWQLQTPQGERLGEISQGVVVTPFFSVLSFRVSGGRWLGCMVFPDSLPPGQYRQLLAKF